MLTPTFTISFEKNGPACREVNPFFHMLFRNATHANKGRMYDTDHCKPLDEVMRNGDAEALEGRARR